jgi:2'-5' RNA ligase
VKGARAFIALELDAPLRARIAALQASLSALASGVRWVAADGIHLTLRFLGESSPAALAALDPALRAAAGACTSSQAAVSGIGMFPERGSPRVLWIGVALPAPAVALQAACEAAAVAAGFPREARPFRPHLTLGRWRERCSRPALPPAELGVARLERLVIFRSELRPEGALYTPLAEFPLGGARAA